MVPGEIEIYKTLGTKRARKATIRIKGQMILGALMPRGLVVGQPRTTDRFRIGLG